MVTFSTRSGGLPAPQVKHELVIERDVFATSLRPDGLAGAMRSDAAGKAVVLAGWVHRVRNLGGLISVDLRDRSGLLQVSFNPEWTPEAVIADAGTLGQEFVVRIEGEIALRPEETRNADMDTGDVELRAKSL